MNIIVQLIGKLSRHKRKMTHLAWRTKASIPEATAADAEDEAAVFEHLPCNPAAG